MATIDSSPVSLLAAADLSSYQYRFCKLTSTGLNLCTVAGERADCVLGNKPTFLGDGATAYVERVFLVTYGDTVTAGDSLTTDTTGRAVLATTGQFINAVAIESGSVGGVYSVLAPLAPAAATTGGIVAVAAPGTISPAADYCLLSVDGTQAFTLADGVQGHKITIDVLAAINTPVGTVTLNGSLAGYASEPTAYVFNAVGQKLTLVMGSSGWKFVEGHGEETRLSGALGLPFTTHFLSVTNTVAFTLAAGLRIGQRKRIECTAVSGTPVGTLTPATVYGAEPATWVFNTVGQAIELEWTATGWKLEALNQMGIETVANAGTANPLNLWHSVAIADTVDFIQPDGLIAGQKSNWIAAANSGTPVGTVSGLFYTVGMAATGVDVQMNAAADRADLTWVGARWFPTTLTSTAIA